MVALDAFGNGSFKTEIVDYIFNIIHVRNVNVGVYAGIESFLRNRDGPQFLTERRWMAARVDFPNLLRVSLLFAGVRSHVVNTLFSSCEYITPVMFHQGVCPVIGVAPRLVES